MLWEIEVNGKLQQVMQSMLSGSDLQDFSNSARYLVPQDSCFLTFELQELCQLSTFIALCQILRQKRMRRFCFWDTLTPAEIIYVGEPVVASIYVRVHGI